MKMEKRVIELAINADRDFIKSATIRHYYELIEENEIPTMSGIIETVIDYVNYGLLEGGGHTIEKVWDRYGLYPDAEYAPMYWNSLVDYTALMVAIEVAKYIPQWLPGYDYESTGGGCDALVKDIGTVQFIATDGNLSAPLSFPIEITALDTTESELYDFLGGAIVETIEELKSFEAGVLSC